MKNAEGCAKRLLELYSQLLAAPLLPKREEWKGDWQGWKQGENWHPTECGVYILWETAGGERDGKPPVYVGEGRLGDRIRYSFHLRKSWQYVQMRVEELICGGDKEAVRWRKALERFCILALEPTENVD